MPNGTYGGVRGRRKSSLLDNYIKGVKKELFYFKALNLSTTSDLLFGYR